MRAWCINIHGVLTYMVYVRKREFDVGEVRKGLSGSVRYHKIWKPHETRDTRLNSITNRRVNIFFSQQHSVRPYCLGTLEFCAEG